MSALGTLGAGYSTATSINKLGTVAGGAYPASGPRHAFIHAAGVMTDLGTLPGDVGSQAFGINGVNLVVGESYNKAAQGHAFTWSKGTMTAIPTLGGTLNVAFGVNDSGWVVGASTVAGDVDAHAFLLRKGSLTDLGTLGGSSSYALAVNNQGEIVGESRVAGDGATHAFAYLNGTMTDLGTLPGLPNSVATAVNNNGDIVGYAYNLATFSQHAFLYHDGVMSDLNSGWTFTLASGINDSGQVVGAGTNPSGFVRAFTLTVPQTPGGGNGTGSDPSSPLLATVSGRLPTTVVSGQRIAPIAQTVTLTNSGATTVSGPVTVNLQLSTDSSGASGGQVVATATLRRVNLRPGQRLRVPMAFRSIPAGLNGDLFVLAQVIDPAAATSLASSPTTISSQAPVIHLTGAVKVVPATVRAGRKGVVSLTVTNQGNVPAVGPLGIDLFLSATGAIDAASQDLGTVQRQIRIQPGRKSVLQIARTIPAGLSGSYIVIAQLSDPNSAFNDANLTSQVIVSPGVTVR
jgi:probable HAF family extracellular repeat protein